MKRLLVLVTVAMVTCPTWASNEQPPPSCDAFLAGTFRLRLAGFQDQLPVQIGDLVSLSTASGYVRGRIDEVFDWGIMIGNTGVPWSGIDMGHSAITTKQPPPEPFKMIQGHLSVAIENAKPSIYSSLSHHLYALESIKSISSRRIAIEPDDLLPMLHLLSDIKYTKFKEAITAVLQKSIIVISKDGSRQTWEQQFGFLNPEQIEELITQLSSPQTSN